MESVLGQPRRYADEQKAKCVSVSDRVVLYAATIEQSDLLTGLPRGLEGRPRKWVYGTEGVTRPVSLWRT